MKKAKRLNQKKLAILLYGLLFGFVLSFVFEGKVYFKLIEILGASHPLNPFVGMLCHMAGLVFAGIFLSKRELQKNAMKLTILGCVVFTPFFLIRVNIVNVGAFCIVAFLSGMAVACWGKYYKECIAPEERMKSMADTLILANILMIIASVVSCFLSAVAGFCIIIVYLFGALVVIEMLAKEKAMGSVGAVAKVDAKTEEKGSEKGPFLFSSMMLLATFIIIVTINSGLMYGVFNKTFEPMEWLASWYWAVPYILVLLILRFTVKKRNSSVYIYLAIMMVAVGFVLFMLLDISAISYVFIDSLLLGASGIMDLFWSSTVGEIFEYTANPVRVLSIGWSANVIGVLIGAIISNEIIAMQLSRTLVTVIALGVTCVSLVILPLLLGRLRVQLKLHLFVSSYQIGGKMEQNIFQKNMSEDLLTNREKEILPLVLQGMSNKSIAAELFVSENTVKTHVRNILSKYQVDNRTQLISKLLMERM